MNAGCKISGNRQGACLFFSKSHRKYPVQGSLVYELYEVFPFLHSFITFATQPFDCDFLQLDMKHIHILKKK